MAEHCADPNDAATAYEEAFTAHAVQEKKLTEDKKLWKANCNTCGASNDRYRAGYATCSDCDAERVAMRGSR